MISAFFHEVFYRPLLNALGLIAWAIPGGNFGLAVIVLTLFVNFLLLPMTHSMKKSQKKMREIEPELQKIKQQYKDQKEEQARLMLELYKQHGINPFSGFLLLFIQIPLFIALYKVFAHGAVFDPADLYSFMPPLAVLNTTLFGVLDLTKSSAVVAAIAAILQFIQGSLLMPQGNGEQSEIAKAMQMQFRYILPGVIFFIGLRLPAALALYWTTMSLFGIVHEVVVRRKAYTQAS